MERVQDVGARPHGRLAVNRHNRDKLRQLAIDAPQGKWTAWYAKDRDWVYATVDSTDFEHPSIATCGVYDIKGPMSVSLARNNRRAKYIASARPEVVLGLLDMVDRLEMAIAQKCSDCPGRRAKLCEGCALEGMNND